MDERVLAVISQSTNIIIEEFEKICNISCSLLDGEQQNDEQYSQLSSTCGLEQVQIKDIVIAIAKILLDATKMDLSDIQFLTTLKNYQFPMEQVKILSKAYNTKKTTIQSIISSQLQLISFAQFDKLDWRIDLETSSRFLNHVNKPIVTLRLKTRSQLSVQSNSTCVRVDYENLKKLHHQLHSALNEINSTHSDRIQRYMK